MNWTDKQHAELARCFESGGVLAVATRAVELMAERGGTMTAGALEMAHASATEMANRGMYGAATIQELLASHSAQGARVAALDGALVRQTKATEHWRQRVEKAAVALSDVAPGELGRLDLVGRIERLTAQLPEGMKGCTIVFKECALGHGRLTATNWVDHGCDTCERDSLRAELARFKPLGEVAEDAALLERAIVGKGYNPECARLALSRLAAGAQEAGALRGELVFCQQERDASTDRASGAEQDREALRAEVERLKAWREKCIKDNNDWAARLTSAESRLAVIRERVEKMTRGADKDELRWLAREDADAPQDTSTAGGSAPQEDLVEVVTVTHGMVGHAQKTEVAVRYPCSPTYIHDDAATPGHPERVKEGSEAFNRTVGTYHPASASAYEQGAEAMRAACLMAVVERLVRHGLQRFREDFKAAIEGAAP